MSAANEKRTEADTRPSVHIHRMIINH